MKIYLNGEEKDVPEDLRLTGLVELFDLPDKRIAIELNRDVVRRTEWDQRAVSAGDRVEVVHFVGGG